MGSLTRPVSCCQIWQLPLQGHLSPVCHDNGKEKQIISSAKNCFECIENKKVLNSNGMSDIGFVED